MAFVLGWTLGLETWVQVGTIVEQTPILTLPTVELAIIIKLKTTSRPKMMSIIICDSIVSTEKGRTSSRFILRLTEIEIEQLSNRAWPKEFLIEYFSIYHH